ncbi:MAG: hypothetical protein AB3N21_15630 [Ruegeria sp.]|uniref:hypothetical protein n=1 Tax=Ruegeria sp. TaxID=1879320 RepID=UPI00349EF601
MATWFDKFMMFRTDILDEVRIKPGLTVFETDHRDTPIMIKCHGGDSDAYAKLTQDEARRLASMLNAFLKKGQD